MEFEWNETKASANKKRHQVTFYEAATVFGGPLAVTFRDLDHSIGEFRFLTFGFSRLNRLLAISHTDREGCIRIISARRATRRERIIYEESEE